MKNISFLFLILTCSQFASADCAVKGTFENWRALSQNKKIIFKFGAKWCPGCLELKPIYEEMACANKDIVFVDVDIDEQKKLADLFKFKQVPYLVSIKDNHVKGKIYPRSSSDVDRLLEQLKK